MTTRNTAPTLLIGVSLLAAALALSACQKQDVPPAAAAGAPVASAPAVPAYTPPTAQQLSQMVAPIALFPDKLVAQVLAGATYPEQIVAANQWLTQNGALKGDILQAAEERQPWDVSVKSLTMFPAVLSQMAANPDWTRSLGDAFVNDPNDVMNAIQELRLRAQQAGNLKNSGQLKVSTTVRSVTPAPVSAPAPYPVYAGAPVIPPPPQTIVIESARPDTVYVPAYNPAVVYGPPVPVYPGYVYHPPVSVSNEVVVGALSFGVGIFVGEAISHHGDWGWHDWGMHWGGGDEHAGPDWQRPAVVYRNTTYVSHSTTVINRVTNNNVTINNTRVVNNNNNSINTTNNVSNINTVNQANRITNLHEAAALPQRNPVPPAAAQSMSLPHFTAADARPGARPAPAAQNRMEMRAEAPQTRSALAALHPQAEPNGIAPKTPAREADRVAEARQHQQMEQQQQLQKEQQQEQQDRARLQAEQEAARNAQSAQAARQQAQERKTLALKQESARAPANLPHAAPPPARPASPVDNHVAAHEHAMENRAAQAHEAPRHEEVKRPEARHEESRQNGEHHHNEHNDGEKHNG